ncbi:uncharacterized protein [Acropora muricata]|uniref:uncharacterized protein n=1 Tax=Acropora muricata TaxID=159855 RepID=UPI0034E41C25
MDTENNEVEEVEELTDHNAAFDDVDLEDSQAEESQSDDAGSESSEESHSGGSEGTHASDAEDPNFMEQDDQIDETRLANVDEAFSDDEGSSSMSPGLTPRALRKRGRADNEDKSPELLSKSPRTPSSPSPTQDSGTNNRL